MFDFEDVETTDTSLDSTYAAAILHPMSDLLCNLKYTFDHKTWELNILQMHAFLKRCYAQCYPLPKGITLTSESITRFDIPAKFVHNAAHKFFKMSKEEAYIARCDLDVHMFLYHIKHILPALDGHITGNKLIVIPEESYDCPSWMKPISFYCMNCDVSLWTFDSDVLQIRFKESLHGSDIRKILDTALESIGPDAATDYVFFRLLCGNRLFNNPDAVHIGIEIVDYVHKHQHINLRSERWFEKTIPIRNIKEVFESFKLI